MRKEARLLKDKALDALILAIEHFNRPYDRGRTVSVLRDLNHAFEMLMKAAIVHRSGKIREPRAKQTIGFDHCVRKGLSEGKVRFLSEEQALTIQMVNALRDAAEHYLVEVSEQQLYVQIQAGVTLFDDLLRSVFAERLGDHMPERVLPVTTNPPRDLETIISDEVTLLRSLIAPGKRRRVEARSRARALAIMEAAVQGQRVQPGDGDLDKLLDGVGRGLPWTRLFPGVSALTLDSGGGGIPFSLRFTKREGVPIHTVPEGTPGAAVVAIKRVDELGFYTLGLKKVAEKVKLSPNKTLAVVRSLRLQDDPEYFKEIRIDSQVHKRYSQKAVDRIKEELPRLDLAAVWQAHGAMRRTKR